MGMSWSLVGLVAVVGFTDALHGMHGGLSNLAVKGRQGVVPKPVNTRQYGASFPPWKPAQPGEVRSPCPGLNTCANHDICPRNGKGYTIPILTKCLKTCLNMGDDFSLFVGGAGIGSNPDFLSLQFDLDQLAHHEMVIEHDASLSRDDASSGNNYSFNQTIFDAVLDYFKGMEDATIPVAAKAKYNRVLTEKARDPDFTYGLVQFIFSYGETAIYLSVMGDPKTGIAPVEYIKVLFEQERLPYEEGWRPTAEPTTLSSLAGMIFELNAANGHELPEGLTVTEGTLKAVLTGLDPITGEVLYPVLQTIGELIGTVSP